MEQIEIHLEGIDFKSGLIPAIIQDYQSKAVLMLAYMNEASLRLSLKTGETHFWSRSRKQLWRKGETSGHIQKIKNIGVDCDQDTLLIEVEQVGVACHTGAPSCFFRELREAGQLADKHLVESNAPNAPRTVLESLAQTIAERKRQPSPSSYTSLLLEGGIDGILKKVGEESAELILGAKNGDPAEIVHEAADLLYHILVTLGYYDISFKQVEAELTRRTQISGLEEKRSRKGKKDTSSKAIEKEEDA